MKRAFTIWEMLIVIMLLGAVGLMMPRIFTPTMRVVREAPAAGNAIITSHVMIEKLRRDVWGASDVRASADGVSLTALSGGREIHWLIQPKQTDNGSEIDITRAGGGDDQSKTWNLSALTMRFEPSPAGTLVRFGPPPQAGDDSILLVNQLAQLSRRSAGGER